MTEVDSRIEIEASPEFVERSKRMTTLVRRAAKPHLRGDPLWDWAGPEGGEYEQIEEHLSRLTEALLAEHDPAYHDQKNGNGDREGQQASLEVDAGMA